MRDEVVGEEFVDGPGLTLDEDLVHEAPHERLVVLDRHGSLTWMCGLGVGLVLRERRQPIA
jgi:hypothetical protein